MRACPTPGEGRRERGSGVSGGTEAWAGWWGGGAGGRARAPTKKGGMGQHQGKREGTTHFFFFFFFPAITGPAGMLHGRGVGMEPV